MNPTDAVTKDNTVPVPSLHRSTKQTALISAWRLLLGSFEESLFRNVVSSSLSLCCNIIKQTTNQIMKTLVSDLIH